MTENLNLSAANFRSCIKVPVILGQSATEILSVFRWVKHFQSGKSSIFDNRGKVKNDKKSNEVLIARAKAMVGEDSRISLEEVASTLNISSGSISSILRNRFG